MLSDRVKQRRKELNMTQLELAEKLGCSDKSTVARVEKGIDSNLSVERLERYAKALETTKSYLIGETDYPYEDNPELDYELRKLLSQLDQKNTSLLKEFATSLLNAQ